MTNPGKSGQSLLEILIALGVGSILIIAAAGIIIPSIRVNNQADKVQMASSFGKELLENVRAFGEGDWHNISNLATSSDNKYFISYASSPFVSATGTEGISSDGVTSGLVGYWKLDEATGTALYDFSGNGNNCTASNGPVSTSGKIGSALLFNGSNNYISTQNSMSLGKTATISFWTKHSVVSSYNVKVLVELSVNFNSNDAFIISFNDNSGGSVPTMGGFLASMHSAAGYSLYATNQRYDNSQWHLVSVVYDRNQLTAPAQTTIYIDGVPVPVTVVGSYNAVHTTSFASNPAFIGDRSGQPYSYDGPIDDVRIYNRTLSATEVKNIYNAGIYTRYFYLDDVGRDITGNIVSGGGIVDPSTKKATVVYGWAGGTTSSFSLYLTRFQNRIFDQTDWSGGPGQDGPSTGVNNQYASSSQINYSTTTGSISIQLY